MNRILSFIGLLSISILLASCSTSGFMGGDKDVALPKPSPTQGTFKVGTPYKIMGKKYHPKETYNFTETGIASWYGPNFHGKPTANGETFDMYELTAAHRTLQMPSLVRVTNLENGRSLVVRINDRGPFSRGRIIDVSKRGAELLGFKNQGTAKVHLELLSQESKAIAQAAKRGVDTGGMEIAINQGNKNVLLQPKPTATPVIHEPAPSLQTAQSGRPLEPIVKTPVVQAEPLPGHLKNGNFLPDPVVKQFPVKRTNIYVQAGAFSQQNNATRYAQKLSVYGNAGVFPAMVNGRQFYRVRFGPLANVDQADTVLERLIVAGVDDAIIIVD